MHFNSFEFLHPVSDAAHGSFDGHFAGMNFRHRDLAASAMFVNVCGKVVA